MCVSGHLLLQLPEQGCEGEFCGFPTAVHSDARETQNSSALPGGHLGLPPPQTALFPWDLIWAVPLVYSPNQKDLEEEIKAFPATTVLGLGYKGASAPECVQGVRGVAQDDVRPVCLHLTCGTEHRCV